MRVSVRFLGGPQAATGGVLLRVSAGFALTAPRAQHSAGCAALYPRAGKLAGLRSAVHARSRSVAQAAIRTASVALELARSPSPPPRTSLRQRCGTAQLRQATLAHCASGTASNHSRTPATRNRYIFLCNDEAGVFQGAPFFSAVIDAGAQLVGGQPSSRIRRAVRSRPRAAIVMA